MSTTKELISRACFAHMEADNNGNAAILQAIHVAECNRYNSNGATMTIDSLRALFNDKTN